MLIFLTAFGVWFSELGSFRIKPDFLDLSYFNSSISSLSVAFTRSVLLESCLFSFLKFNSSFPSLPINKSELLAFLFSSDPSPLNISLSCLIPSFATSKRFDSSSVRLSFLKRRLWLKGKRECLLNESTSFSPNNYLSIHSLKSSNYSRISNNFYRSKLFSLTKSLISLSFLSSKKVYLLQSSDFNSFFGDRPSKI